MPFSIYLCNTFNSLVYVYGKFQTMLPGYYFDKDIWPNAEERVSLLEVSSRALAGCYVILLAIKGIFKTCRISTRPLTHLILLIGSFPLVILCGKIREGTILALPLVPVPFYFKIHDMCDRKGI